MPLISEVSRKFPLQIPTRLPLRQLCASLQDTGWAGTWGLMVLFQSDHALEISLFHKLKLPALLFNIWFDPLWHCSHLCLVTYLPPPTHTHTNCPSYLCLRPNYYTYVSLKGRRTRITFAGAKLFPVPSVVSKALTSLRTYLLTYLLTY